MEPLSNYSVESMYDEPAVMLKLDRYYQENSLSDLIAHCWRSMVELIEDPRAKHLPFMDNPLPTLGLIIIYLLWVLLIGPMYMRDRKPMDLRRVIIFYNLFQVLLSGYMFYEHLMAGWLRGYSISCQTVDYTDSPLSRRMFNLCYVYYLSKLTEFADTIFFVLRKKQSQITDLHVYHHSLTPMEAWILTKFIAGGNATFPNIINNFVHVLMYFYYMLSAMGPRYQKYLWWKKYMTEVQIIQFVLCIGHCINALVTGCGFPKFISTLLLINASIFLCLFMNFYIESYKRRPKGAATPAPSPIAEAPAKEPQAVAHSAVEELELTEPVPCKPPADGPCADDINNNNWIEPVGPQQTETPERDCQAQQPAEVPPELPSEVVGEVTEVTDTVRRRRPSQEGTPLAELACH